MKKHALFLGALAAAALLPGCASEPAGPQAATGAASTTNGTVSAEGIPSYGVTTNGVPAPVTGDNGKAAAMPAPSAPAAQSSPARSAGVAAAPAVSAAPASAGPAADPYDTAQGAVGVTQSGGYIKNQPTSDSLSSLFVPAGQSVRMVSKISNISGTWWYVIVKGGGDGWMNQSQLAVMPVP